MAYTLSADDVAGPYVARIPDDMMEKRTLDVLAYTSPAEMLAERFHTTPRLLTRLNPGVTWKEGEVIQVPNVLPFMAPAATETRKVDPPDAARVADVRVSCAAEHYGLHGTPEPARIGVSQSHGCVRLTSWDAMRVASLVQTGTPVLFEP